MGHGLLLILYQAIKLNLWHALTELILNQDATRAWGTMSSL